MKPLRFARGWLLCAPSRTVLSRARPRHLLIWSAIFALVACNAIWGIDDGKLAEPGLAGAPAVEPGGGAPPEAGAAGHAGTGEAGESAGGTAGSSGASGAGGEEASQGGAGSSAGSGGSAGSVSGSGGSVSGSGGSMSGMGGGGTGPSCSGCKAGETQSENQNCGRCGTGTQSRTRTCDDKCTWGAWSGWSLCSQCDAKPYRCCGAGKWEWCYDEGCAWTQDCEPCVASSCPEC